MLEALAFSLVVYLGGFTSGYFYKDDVVCPRITYTIPYGYLEEYSVADCMEDSESIECDIAYPRYVVPESEYKGLSEYVKGIRVNLTECESVINMYNDSRSE